MAARSSGVSQGRSYFFASASSGFSRPASTIESVSAQSLSASYKTPLPQLTLSSCSRSTAWASHSPSACPHRSVMRSVSSSASYHIRCRSMIDRL